LQNKLLPRAQKADICPLFARVSEYLENAKEFAKMALESKQSAVPIQNAHKAMEFALCWYAEKMAYRIPRE